MKYSHALLIAGILVSLSGSIALLASTFLAHSTADSTALPAWVVDTNLLAPVANRSNAAGEPDSQHAIAVVLARMLHRSDTGKLSGS